ncbi:M13 family peptidase [bacterium]|nr:MAG: M13 family peptidase [bacterium]
MTLLTLVLSLTLPALSAEVPSVDLSSLDRSAKPCADFFQFSCGGWMKANPIPADQSRWGRFSVLAEDNRKVLKGILEEAAAAPKDDVDRRIGGLYAGCMDEAAAEKLAAAPVQPLFDAVVAWDGGRTLAPLLARLHRAGASAGFGYGSDIDAKASTSVIAGVDQSGLSLPDRDYYLKDDAKSVETREAFRAHAAKVFGLLGSPAASGEADAVLRVETALAKASMDRTLRRDPDNVYHKMGREGLKALAPAFDWDAYLAAAGGPAWAEVNVASPGFLEGFSALLASAPTADLRSYLRWHAAGAFVPRLSKAFVDADFEFYGKRLTGAKELKPRWKRCVELTDRLLGEDLGRRYVAKAYPPEVKARMDALVAGVEAALGKGIGDLGWMGPATKKLAQEKLAAIENKVGYPKLWRDYSSVKVDRADLHASVASALGFELDRQLAKIGQPVDRGEWYMTPPTVNAYYDPNMNTINFPAGILQPPFFDGRRDAAANYGGIGGVIGHELTHGFDDQGRRFDAKGNLTDWWTQEDAAAFETRASCIADQYAAYESIPGVTLNGRLTLGENTADSGGLRTALAAYRALPAAERPKLDGFTGEQRVFLGFAQIWCMNRTDQAARLLALTDPHSPPRARVNGPMVNMPEFAEAFACKAGDAMVAPKPCRVW